MGVTGLWQILESVGHPVKIDGLEGKRLGVDANVWLYKFVRGFREKDTAVSIEGHKLGLFNRISKLLFYKIKPIFVFDGPAPALKRKTLEKRQNVRSKHLLKVQDAAMKLLAEQLKEKYPNANIDHIMINLPELTTNNLVAAEKFTDEDRELFYLPPEVHEVVSDESEDDICYIGKKVKNENKIDGYSNYELYKDMNLSVDIHSEEFACLPPEVRYELLVDIRESRRKLRRSHDLPEDSSSFSSFQMDRLRSRRIIQEKIEQCEKEICSTYTGECDGRILQTYRVQSDSSSTMLYYKRPSSEIVEQTVSSSTFSTDTSTTTTTTMGHSVPLLQSCGSTNKEDGCYVSDTFRSEQVVGQQHAHERAAPQVTTKIVDEAKELLRLFDVPYIDALGEAEKFTDEDRELFYLPPEVHEVVSDESEDDICYIGKKVKNENKIDGYSNYDLYTTSKSWADLFKSEGSALSTSSVNGELELHHSGSENSVEEIKIHKSSCLETEDTLSTSSVNGELELHHSGSENSVEEIKSNKSSCLETEDALSTSSVNGELELHHSGSENSVEEIKSNKSSRLETEDAAKNNSIDSSEEIRSRESAKRTSDKLTPEMAQKIDSIDPEHSVPLLQSCGSTNKEDGCYVSDTFRSEQVVGQQHAHERAALRVTTKIVDEAKELLRLFGIPYIDALGEAEAQCALLEELKLTEGTITDDSDVWLFGARNVYRYFFNDDKYVMHYKMTDIEFHIRMTRENLICLAMLVGSDYTEGIMNVGPVTALEILSEFPGSNLDPLIKFKNWKRKFEASRDKIPGSKKRESFLKFRLPEEFPSRAVFEGYMRPSADTSTAEFSWGTPELDELREYARRNFGWDSKKIDEKLLPVMKKLSERKSQPTIDSFFFKTAANQNPELFRSRRVNEALTKLAKKTDSKLEDEVVCLSEDDSDPEGEIEIAISKKGTKRRSQQPTQEDKKEIHPPKKSKTTRATGTNKKRKGRSQ